VHRGSAAANANQDKSGYEDAESIDAERVRRVVTGDNSRHQAKVEHRGIAPNGVAVPLKQDAAHGGFVSR
jgi:hypothetical protein